MDPIVNKRIDLLPEMINHKDVGLYHGKMGLCLAHYIKGRMDEAYTLKAESLFDEIIEDLADVNIYNFSDGLMGIGWAVEWLTQHNFITLNTDEFLEELDDEIYKLIMYSKAKKIDLNTGTLGRILYLYKRVTAQNSNRNFYKEVCNKECLVLLIDELYEKLISGENAILHQEEEFESADLKSISQALIMLCKLEPLRFNYELVNEMICKIISKIERLLTDHPLEKWNNELIYLIGAWSEAGQALSCQDWVSKAHNAYVNVKMNIDIRGCNSQQIFILKQFESLDYEVNPDLFSCLVDLNPEETNTSCAEAWLLK